MLEDETVMEPVSSKEMLLSIQEILHVLSNFKQEREEGKSRSDYKEELKQLFMRFFGYNYELCDYFINMFNPAECFEYMDASDKKRPEIIRCNTLKTNSRHLLNLLHRRGMTVELLSKTSKEAWGFNKRVNVGMVVSASPVPTGATPEYLTGLYFKQGAASMLPVMCLEPQPGEFAIDMAAAPGGKSTFMGALMKNQGVLICNDFNKLRLKSITGNIQRLGITNAVVTNYDGRKLSDIYKNADRVLLDAPCTGLGVVSKDQSIKTRRTLQDIRARSKLQKELLLAAIDCVNPNSKTGGYVVYSTCSVAVEENEEVASYAIRKRNVKILPLPFPEGFGEPGFRRFRGKVFDDSVKHTRRFYPHTENLDGFYVCKFKVLKRGEIKRNFDLEEEEEEEEESEGEQSALGKRKDRDSDE